MNKCMFKDCDRDTNNGARGLCNLHYAGWFQRVKRGATTWEQLEEDGMCKRKLTQAEKNMNQMHPHRSYNRKK